MDASKITHVTPVETSGKVLASLGIVFVAIAVYVLYRRSAKGRAAEEIGGFSARTPWRLPNIIMLVVCMILVQVGVWIDPAKHVVAFLLVWMAALTLTLIVMVVGIFDWLIIRRRAYQARLKLLEKNRQKLRAELTEYYRARSPEGNGDGKSDGL